MRVRILQGVEGAREATGAAVIIDVFRAFTVEAWLLHNGAAEVRPVAGMDEAYALGRQGYLLLGERGGAIQEGFAYGNSPSAIAGVDLTGVRVAHTTSAGTQGVAGASRADAVFAAALVNARATAQALLAGRFDDVSLVCMGLAGREPTDEDTLCAEYIAALLRGETMPLADAIERLKTTSGAKFFDPARQSVFPQADFAYCTEVDRFPFAMRVRNGRTEAVNPA